MNKLLQEEIWRQRVRQMHKSVIREAKLLNEADLYSTFIEPFTDIIDAAKLTGQDILNSLVLQFDMLFSLGTKGIDDAINKFDKRKGEVGKKWEPIMKRNDEALEAGDADLIAFVLNPTAFLTTEAAMAAYDTAESTYDYLDGAGLRLPLVGALFGGEAGSADRTGGGDDKTKDDQGKEKNLLQKLAGLFYFESAWHEGDLILEQEEEDKEAQKKKLPLDKAMEQYLEETGIKDKLEEDAKELMKSQEELVQKVLDEVLPRLSLITALTTTADVDEFVEAINKAEQEGLDLKAAGMDKIKTDVEESAKKLGQSAEFRAQAAETAGVDVEKLSDEDALTAAKKVAFTNAKQEFDEQGKTGKEKLKEEALVLLKEKFPNETNMKMMKGSKEGEAFIKILEDAKQKIENA